MIIANILWFIFGGLLLGLSWALLGILLCITIVGIPFAWQHIKLAELALFPIGKTIVPCEVAAEARRRRASEEFERVRNSR